MPKFRRAVVGGTFDHLHLGHVALIRAAFRVGREVAVGVTTDRFLVAHPKPDSALIQPYATRVRVLRRFLATEYPRARWTTGALDDPFGGSVLPGVDVLVVSAETANGADLVNAERRRLGRSPVPVATVPIVLADDLGPISSRRIRAGEIDREGHRRAPIRVGVAADLPEALPVMVRTIRRAFRSARVAPRPAPLGRPRGASAPRAAVLAGRAMIGTEFAVGLAGRPPGPWTVVIRSPSVLLPPRRIRPGTIPALERGLYALLRPGVERNAFPSPRTSRR